MKITSVAILLLLGLVRAQAAELSTSGALVEEVLSQSEDAKGYDWRRMRLQLAFDASFIYEANVFQSRSYGLSAFRSLNRGWLLRGALRRTETSETASSRQLALTIYSQAAQPSHYELLVGGGYMLLDGRSSTALNPRLTDLGHALMALAGVHYNHFDHRDPAPLPGMRAVYSDWVAEAGLRFQVYLPHSLGAAVEWTIEAPLHGGDPELPHWQRFGGSLSWSFAD
jgi:hypothetical protein